MTYTTQQLREQTAMAMAATMMVGDRDNMSDTLLGILNTVTAVYRAAWCRDCGLRWGSAAARQAFAREVDTLYAEAGRIVSRQLLVAAPDGRESAPWLN